MKRFLAAIGMASVITLSLFYLMSVLITGGTGPKRSEDVENFIDFVRVKPQEHLETRQRKLPQKPPEPKKPPMPENLAVQNQAPTPKSTNLNMDIPKFDLAAAGGGASLFGGGSSSDSSAPTPLVRMPPIYPEKAKLRGLEGHVILTFDINSKGMVANVRVDEAKPRGVFEDAARRSLLKYRYKPKVVNGKPTVQRDVKIQLDFNLEEEGA